MPELIELDSADLALSLGLVAMAIAFSRWQRLELEGQLLLATGRTIVQLLVVGYILTIVFAVNQPGLVLGIGAIMLTIAAKVASNRISEQQKGLLPIIWLSLLVSSTLTLSYALAVILRPEPWYAPQYLIPLLGMVLGNAMNSAALAGERLATALAQNRLEVETHLCLGATAKQAIQAWQKEGIRVSLIPTLNQMMVVGLVSLPGMFTGQVLSGSHPLNAASYQILILLMIAVTNLLTAWLVTEGVYRRFFNNKVQLVDNS
jgi:putative ABC transport system permease protein